MLRHRGGGSHVVQAYAPPFGVTLAGLFATQHYCCALATFSRIAPGFCQRFPHRYGPAQVGFGLCYQH